MTVTTTSNARRRKSMRKILSRVILYALVVLIMVWTLAPFVWLCITSISTQAKLNRIPIQWLPDPPTFEHYAAMFDPANPTGALFLAALRNSLVIAGTTTILCLLFGVLAAYALARFVFPAKNVLIMGMLATRLLPTIALVVPFYVIIVSYIDPIFPMFDTRHNLVILYMSFIIGLVVWIMRGYFATIPRELEDAAMVDGCTRLQALTHVILPLSVPGLVTIWPMRLSVIILPQSMFDNLVRFVRIFLRVYFLSVSDFLDVYFSLFFIYFEYDSQVSYTHSVISFSSL